MLPSMWFALRPFETGLAKTGFGWNRFWLKPVFVETGFDCRETGFELKPVLIETGFGMAVRQSKRSPKFHFSRKNCCSSVKTFAKNVRQTGVALGRGGVWAKPV